MNRADTIREVVERGTEYLQRDKSKRGYICPICGSGSGRKGTGITENKNYPHHFTCWSGGGCFKNADIIEIIGKQYHCNNFEESFERACSELNIEYVPKGDSDSIAQEMRETRRQANARQREQEPIEKSQLSFIEEASSHISQCDYLTKRGISQATQELYKIGYCKAWRHSKAPNAPATERLIIPTSDYSYIARDLTPNGDKAYRYQKEGKVRIFNIGCIEDSEHPVFITEGEIDALSIIDRGYNAVALGGVSNIGELVEYCKTNKPGVPLIIALDTDSAGIDATEKLEQELKKADIECYVNRTLYGNCKDANEALVASKEAFSQALAIATDQANKAKAQRVEHYKAENNTSSYIGLFLNEISASASRTATSTGIKAVDNMLDGGLYEGLYILGAITSLGKTTLGLQIADNIAKAGKDILIFSLEMSRTELMAKSISRETAQISIEASNSLTGIEKSTRQILNGSWYKNYSKAELERINEAVNNYRKYASHLYIKEGIGNIGVESIRQAVEEHISVTGITPIVFVDYLQILAPDPSARYITDKQNIDKAVLELKRLSRDYKTAVIAISSFNRDNYNQVADMQAFKESGAIEYGCDCLIALQLKGVETEDHKPVKDFNIADAMTGDDREIELKILKNRNGKTRQRTEFIFYPKYNYFYPRG